MSCTIVSLPLLLIIGVLNVTGTLAANALNNNDIMQKDYLPKDLSSRDLVNILCKEYDTVFMDKDLLMKTLEEHGATDFEEVDGKIICKVDDFSLEFSKNENEPYKMNVTCTCTDNLGETVEDINAEYALNVQEESYLKLKERLAQQKLQIEEEEILEDNSIMLTVNLE